MDSNWLNISDGVITLRVLQFFGPDFEAEVIKTINSSPLKLGLQYTFKLIDSEPDWYLFKLLGEELFLVFKNGKPKFYYD